MIYDLCGNVSTGHFNSCCSDIRDWSDRVRPGQLIHADQHDFLVIQYESYRRRTGTLEELATYFMVRELAIS